jgi:hypothetical protein
MLQVSTAGLPKPEVPEAVLVQPTPAENGSNGSSTAAASSSGSPRVPLSKALDVPRNGEVSSGEASNKKANDKTATNERIMESYL